MKVICLGRRPYIDMATGSSWNRIARPSKESSRHFKAKSSQSEFYSRRLAAERKDVGLRRRPMAEQRSAGENGHEKRWEFGKKQGKNGWLTYTIKESKSFPVHLYAAIRTKNFFCRGQRGPIPRLRGLRGRRRNECSPIIALLKADGSPSRRLWSQGLSRWRLASRGLSR
jgi:hypothetical protein